MMFTQPFMMFTQPFPILNGQGSVRYVAHLGSDESVVEAARMSTQRGFVSWEPYRRCKACDFVQVKDHIDSEILACSRGGLSREHNWQDFPRGDNGILETMYRDRHMTPFEMCELVVDVKAPIFIFRELHRHRTFSINEMSARYTQMPDEHYVPALERFKPKYTGDKQADSVRPLSQSNFVGIAATAEQMQLGMATEQEETYANYEFLLENGVPKEVARANTPVSRMSVMRWKANLRNWMQMFALREPGTHAQWECQDTVRPIVEIATQLFPRTMKLYDEYTRGAVTLSRTEVELIRELLDHVAAEPKSERVQKLVAKLKGTAA